MSNKKNRDVDFSSTGDGKVGIGISPEARKGTR